MGGKTCNHTSGSKKLFSPASDCISVHKFSVYFTYERKTFNDRPQQHPVASAGPFVCFPIHFRFHSRSCPIRSGKENSKPSVPLHQASRKKPATSKKYRLNVLSHCLEPVEWGRTHVFRCVYVCWRTRWSHRTHDREATYKCCCEQQRITNFKRPIYNVWTDHVQYSRKVVKPYWRVPWEIKVKVQEPSSR